MLRTFLVLTFLGGLGIHGTALGQNHTVSGFVEDASSGEKLIGANVYETTTFKGTTSNVYGFYSLTLPAGKHRIAASFVGYEKVEIDLDLKGDTTLRFRMGGAIGLKEFEIVESQAEKIQEQSQMSRIDVPVKTIQKIPSLLGEKDVLKALQLLPGVQSGSEGSSGLYVRGGGPDQNLILLDGVPVYNAAHLFGFFSVFNPDAITSVELIKGGFPAHYGGRLSSVIDIRMKEGHMNEFHGVGTIGLLSTKLTLEGPIIKDKASFVVSGRRTYADLLLRPVIKNQFKKNGVTGVGGYYFYDLTGKVNFKLSEKDRLYLSAYMGDDEFYFDVEWSDRISSAQDINQSLGAGLRWGNKTTALRYNRVLNNKLFANLTATYSRYYFNVGQEISVKSNPPDPEYTQDLSFEYNSGIYDWSARLDFDYIPTPNHYVKFGAGDIYHTFTPGVSVFDANIGGTAIDTTFGEIPIFAHEYFAYAEDDIKLGARLKMNLGLHFSGFIRSGDHYYSLQPRVSARYLINEFLSVKASYAQMQQYIHLLTNATIGLPTDLWVPSTDRVKPEDSRQVALGVAQMIRDKYEISIEGYYKQMSNLIEYKEGAGFFSAGTDWQDKITFGKGWSYGVELFLQKKVGKTAGWIGYTLSWTTREFEALNFGKPFPYRYDRRHDVSVVLTQEIADNVDFAATWVYGTGNAISLPLERYSAPANNNFYAQEIYYYEKRNGTRMAAYHRLDIGFDFHKERKHWKRTWSVGFYNTYNRRNPFFLYFQDVYTPTESGDVEVSKELIQVSIFPVLPYVAYTFEF